MEFSFQSIKDHLKEVSRIKKAPHSVAGGFALGTFISILPTFGFGILIGLLLLLFFKKISKISLLVSFAVWNPLILATVYPVSYIVGNAILSESTAEVGIINKILSSPKSFLLGSFISAIVVSIISYLFVFSMAHHYQKIRRRRKQKKLEKMKRNI